MAYSVLIVDDEAGIRESLREIFEDEGYEVFTAEAGEEAIQMIDSIPVDLVFLDIWLPDRDGIEVLEDIKTRREQPPCCHDIRSRVRGDSSKGHKNRGLRLS